MLTKGDSLAYRPVEIGRLSDDGLRVVRTGVAEGDQVVVNGLMRVRPGMKVSPKMVAMVSDSSDSTVAER